MSLRYPGGIITKTPTAPTTSAAVGVWTLDQALQYQKAGTWPLTTQVDNKYNYVTSLLLGNGTNQVANTTVTDSSLNALSISRSGSPRQTSLTPYSQVDGSVYFGATGYLYQSVTGPGTGAFTYEMWFNLSSLAAQRALFNSRSGDTTDGFDLYITTAGTIYGTYSGTVLFNSAAGIVSTNNWYHIAVVRNGSGNWVCYLNGVSVATRATTATNFNSTTFQIGSRQSGADLMYGYISNFRYATSAIYTTTFTPPINSLTTSSQGATGVSFLGLQVSSATSNNAFSNIGTTGGTLSLSVANSVIQMPVSPFGMLSGGGSQTITQSTSSYLYTGSSSVFAFGTGDFTIEAWVYPTTLVSDAGFFQTSATSGGLQTSYANGAMVYASSGTTWACNVGNNGTITSSAPVVLNQWTHVAVVRNSGTLNFYINGVSIGSQANTVNLTGTYMAIGGYYSTSYLMNGQIANVRVVKGTAIYTGTFKPPFAAFTTTNASSAYPSTTNVTTGITASNTSLLLNTTDANFSTATGSSLNNNTFLDSSPNAFTMTRYGSTTQGTFSPFAPAGESWSTYFLGGQRLNTTTSSTSLDIGGSTFTVELWAYPTQWSGGEGNMMLCTAGAVDGSSNSMNFRQYGSSSILQFILTSISLTTPISAVSLNTWTHLAVTYDSSASRARLFVNGVLKDNQSVTNTAIGAALYASVGNELYSGQRSPFYGYISNARIIKGSIPTEYQTSSTTNGTTIFTVPTSPLTNVTNTVLLTCQSNRFQDASNNNFAFAVVSTPSIQRFQPFLSSAAYTSSLVGGSYYDNNTGGLVCGPSTSLGVGGTFTIECWVYLNSYLTGGASIYDVRTSNEVGVAYISNAGAASFQTTGTGTLASKSGVTLREWHHVAFVSDSTSSRVYVDGSNTGGTNQAQAQWPSNSRTAYVFSDFTPGGTSGYRLDGYVSNLRVIKGTALYTANFIPPTSPEAVTSVPPNAQTSLALNFTNPAIADSSMVGNYITVADSQTSTAGSTPFGSGYAMKFDGTGDWITAISSPSYSFGAGDFTIEAWINPSINNAYKTFLTTGAVNGTQITVRMTDTGKINVYYGNGTGLNLTGTTTLSTGTWYYIAVVRSGSGSNNFKIYVNGTQDAVTTNTDTVTSSGSFAVGGDASSNSFNGYISNVRITKGYARTISASPTANFPTQGQQSTGSPTIKVFNGSSTWTAPAGVTSVNVMIVAGGGGGGLSKGGGGGAGGYLYQTGVTVIPGSTYPIIIGAGGAAGVASTYFGVTGSNSSALGYLSIGGGGGAKDNDNNGSNGLTGGSGGGGSRGGVGGSGTSGQGYAGGGSYNGPSYGAGGGGGAGGVGADGVSATGGNGGVGSSAQSALLASAGVGVNVSGTYYIAGGGAGGCYVPQGGAGGTGGNGGGGNGQGQGSNYATSGTLNTGGGGGGGENFAGNGASGIVIISY